MTTDQENERNERWLEQLLNGVRNSNQSAEDVAQRCYLLTHPSHMPTEDGMKAIGEIADGIVARLGDKLESERKATERAAADLGDKLATLKRA